MKMFVPGRICLFGEHSDWAGGYRRINAELEKGYALITGTNQGLYAEVESHPSRLIFKSSLDGDPASRVFEIPMDTESLLQAAQEGGVFSYAAGVAYQVLIHYRVRGLVIDNYKTDLPVKKGLSSSAAVCVLVARAFNRIYDLKMTVRGEMEFAYLGEITTPSRCGRMDQGCAYGNRPVMMTFDGERVDVTEVHAAKNFFFVIVDLNAGKDTLEILKDLNRCYPFADDELQRRVQKYLGPISARLTHEALAALQAGDARKIADLMNRAQAAFDEHVAPASPSQLKAPVLHKLLSYKPLKKYVLGGKGVGSQGDGTAQLIVRSREDQQKAIEIIEKELLMPCLELTLEAGRKVRKAVIPAAGFGTRMFPASKAIKKELFPIIDRKGKIKPVIMAIVEEALNAGITDVCLVVQSADREIFENFFGSQLPVELFNKLAKEDRDGYRHLMEIGQKVSFVSQDSQEGFGHAVYCAKEWVGNEPFLLLLGDHLYASGSDTPCARQVLDVYERVGHSVVGMKITGGHEIQNFGCVTGIWKEPKSTLSVTEFVEKPDLEYARTHLQLDDMEKDSFLSVFGQYVLDPAVFDYLEAHIAGNFRENGEFQLTSCLDRLRQEKEVVGYVVDGKRFDIGLPETYRQTVVDFRNA